MAYRGSVIRLPVGLQGFSGSRNPTQLQAGHFEDVEGLSIDGGLLQKEGGASKLNSTALGSGAAVLSGISYSPSPGNQRDAVFLGNGSVLKDDGTGSFSTTLASGLNADTTPPPWFTMGGGEGVGDPRTLFLFSASNQVQAEDGDGSTFAAISNPPSDWSGSGNFPTFGIMHEGRLWGGGNASDPHRIYFSSLSDHQDFRSASGGGTLAIYPGRGERLVGGVSFKGLLILFKYPQGVYTVETSDPSPDGWRVEEMTTAVGSLNQHTIVPIENDVMYLDQGGSLHLLSATAEYGDAETSDVSQIADLSDFIRRTVSMADIRKAVGVWYGFKQQAQFAFPTDTGSVNDLRLIADLSAPQIGLRFLLSRRDEPVSMWMRPGSDGVEEPVHGDDDGFVWLMDQDARDKDGNGYEFAFETANMDLSFVDPKLATLNKTGDFLELIFEPQGDWDLRIQVVWDDVPGPTLLFSMGGDGAALGSFTLGSDILSSSAISSIRKRIAGSGRRLRIIGHNENANETIALSDFYLSFRAQDERMRRGS